MDDLLNSEVPSSKCVLFWFFSIQLLKKHTLNPELTLFVSISCSKSYVKSSQNLQHKFLDWKWPPLPLVLFRKFIQFGSGALPINDLVLISPIRPTKATNLALFVVRGLQMSQNMSSFCMSVQKERNQEGLLFVT